MADIQHPFSGSKGMAARDMLALQVGNRDGFACFLCGCNLYNGRKQRNSRVLEHLEPWKLSPDKAYDPDNLKLCCKRCHDSTCASIEAAFPGNPKMMCDAKLRAATEW